MVEALHVLGRGRIADLCWSPDGANLAVAGTRGIWLYAANDWKAEPRLVIEHENPLLSAAFSPDGALIAAGTGFGTVRVWTTAGEARHVFEGLAGEINLLAFGSNGLLAATGQGGMVRVWDVHTGRRRLLLTTLRPGEEDINQIHGLAFSPDGQFLAAGCSDGQVRLWDAGTGALLRILKGKGPWIASLAYSPDGETIAAGRLDGSAWIWEAATGEDLFIMEGHSEPANHVTYCPKAGSNGPLVASGGGEDVVLWASASGGYLSELAGHIGGVTGLAFSPDGARLAVASRDNALRLWTVNHVTGSGQLTETISAHMAGVQALAWPESGLVSASEDDIMRGWDVETGKLREVFECEPGSTRCFTYSPDESLLAFGGEDGLITVENAESGDVVFESSEHNEAINDLAFSPDGELLASASADRLVRIWDVQRGGQVRALTEFSGGVTCVAFSADGDFLAVGAEDGVVRLYDTARWSREQRFTPDGGVVYAVTFSPDGSVLAAACQDRTVRLWGMEERAALGVLRGHRAAVTCLAFNPEGRALASGSADADVRLWDTLTDNLLHVLEGHRQAVTGLAWNEDGSRLASGSAEGAVRVWAVT
jgi:WD40 repeat protein